MYIQFGSIGKVKYRKIWPKLQIFLIRQIYLKKQSNDKSQEKKQWEERALEDVCENVA